MAHSTQFGGPWRSAARLKGCSVGAGVRPVAELLFQAKKGGASENVKTDFSFPAGENKYL